MPSNQNTDRADHRGYVETVCAAVAATGITLGKRAFGHSELRTATVHLVPPPEGDPDAEPWAYTFANALEVLLCWSEESGWFLAAPSIRNGARVSSPWFKGFEVLPAPDDVASWVDLLLVMPVEGSREDGPYRSARDHDPAFEARLAAYSSPTPPEH